MEEAKITQIGEPEQKLQNQPMYQQGRFPSVVDTDDLVFELGKQAVDRINKEKLLESVLKKIKVLEVGVIKAQELQMEAERKVLELKSSNKLYEENNKKLDKELVNVRNELESQKREVVKVKSEFDSKNVESLKVEQLKKEAEECYVKIKKELIKIKNEFDEQRCIYEENEKKLNEEISNLKNNSGKSKKKTRKKNLKG